MVGTRFCDNGTRLDNNLLSRLLLNDHSTKRKAGGVNTKVFASAPLTFSSYSSSDWSSTTRCAAEAMFTVADLLFLLLVRVGAIFAFAWVVLCFESRLVAERGQGRAVK